MPDSFTLGVGGPIPTLHPHHRSSTPTQPTVPHLLCPPPHKTLLFSPHPTVPHANPPCSYPHPNNPTPNQPHLTQPTLPKPYPLYLAWPCPSPASFHQALLCPPHPKPHPINPPNPTQPSPQLHRHSTERVCHLGVSVSLDEPRAEVGLLGLVWTHALLHAEPQAVRRRNHGDRRPAPHAPPETTRVSGLGVKPRQFAGERATETRQGFFSARITQILDDHLVTSS